jgi:hypothetical protein
LELFELKRSKILDALIKDRVISKNKKMRVSNFYERQTKELQELFDNSYLYSLVIQTVQTHQIYHRAIIDIIRNSFVKSHEILRTRKLDTS